MTTTAHEEQHATERLAHALEERVKELHCLYDVSAILADEERSVDEKLQSIVERLPAGMQFSSIATARLRLDNRTFESTLAPKVAHQQSSDIRVADNVVGQIAVVYTKNPPDWASPAFLREEALLVHEVAQRIADFLTSEWRRQRAHRLETQSRPRTTEAATTTRSDGPQGLVADSGRTFGSSRRPIRIWRNSWRPDDSAPISSFDFTSSRSMCPASRQGVRRQPPDRSLRDAVDASDAGRAAGVLGSRAPRPREP